VSLYRAGNLLEESRVLSDNQGEFFRLPPGEYFLRVGAERSLYYPLPLTAAQAGPEADGSFLITVREPPSESPPLILPHLPPWVYIPSGNFLFGDSRNPREQHYLWLTGFFIAPFEVTNQEFGEFLRADDGYGNRENWTEAGWQWKEANRSNVTALLAPESAEYAKFGQPDQPVTWVNWFEAVAFCRWLTRNEGEGKWWFSLPNEAEWEKAARGPDNFEFSLSRRISDREAPLYNWKKNPIAEIAVIGIEATRRQFSPNRYGLYHMTGNVVEWTTSVFKPFSRKEPFRDDARNREDTRGLRVARGGSWYSASIAYVAIPYRDAFQPEHSSQDIGFRLVARRLP
jgi:formylglycine-generating enzyme required for sulfatase activity